MCMLLGSRRRWPWLAAAVGDGNPHCSFLRIPHRSGRFGCARSHRGRPTPMAMSRSAAVVAGYAACCDWQVRPSTALRVAFGVVVVSQELLFRECRCNPRRIPPGPCLALASRCLPGWFPPNSSTTNCLVLTRGAQSKKPRGLVRIHEKKQAGPPSAPARGRGPAALRRGTTSGRPLHIPAPLRCIAMINRYRDKQ